MTENLEQTTERKKTQKPRNIDNLNYRAVYITGAYEHKIISGHQLFEKTEELKYQNGK